MYCNSILKILYIYFIPFLSHHLWLSHSLNSVLIVSLSFSLSLSSLSMLFASIGVSWVKWWIGMVGCGLWVLDLGWSGRFSGYFLGWLCGFDVFWVFSGLISVSWPHGSSSDRCVFGIFFLYFIGWSCGFDVFWVFSGLISVSWVKLWSMWLQRFSGLIISVFLGIFDGLGFKLTAWVSDRWLYWWFVFSGLGSIDGFWSVALMIGGMGLMVCVCVALLMVWWFVFMCGFVDGLCLCLCLCVCVCGDGFG